jgi:hypothetical protein
VAKPYQQWIRFLYGPFFKVIGLFYRTYKSNRDWVDDLKSQEWVSSFIKYAAVIILIGWFFIWYFAPEGSSDRLVEEVKETIGGLKSLSE